MAERLTFKGVDFELSESIALMALMRFASFAKAGVDSDDIEGLVVMYEFIEQFLAEDDWQRFQAHAVKTRASGEDLLGFVQQAMAVIAERPTAQPSGSSDGQPTTAPSSMGGSSSRVIGRLEQQGRPDLALVVKQAQEARAS